MYHPGRGVYRSAAKNARRLAVTEVNAAYRKADAERWGALDFVVGVEVRTSGNHTCLGSDGKPHPFRDICDELAGRYPKDFVFSGWHPQCRCHAVPILKTPEEMEADGRRIMAGEEPIAPEESENAVTQMPEEFRAWEEANADRLERAREKGRLPWFYTENRSVIDGKPVVPMAPAAKAPAAPAAKAEAAAPDVKAVETALGMKCGDPMTFEEANEMRGNPNYRKGVKYRVNCQCSVLANEMRRRGFDVEAFGNTKQDWYMPSVLAKKPEIAFIGADGKPPVPKSIRYNGDLASSLNGEMSDPGRYHLRFRFGNGGGHVITAERLPDGKLRIYDPQSGRLIKDFKEYTGGVDVNTFEYYRVDNLQLNPQVARGSVKAAGAKGDAPRMDLPEIKDFLEKGWYGEEDYYSPEIARNLKSFRDKNSKEKYMDSLLKNQEFSEDYVAENGCKTVLHPAHKIKDQYWPHTRKMAHDLNRGGRDVVFLPEHDNISMADAVVKINGIPRVVDFKYSASVKPNTLQGHLVEGFKQAGAVVLKLENMDSGQFREAIEYMKRNDLLLGDIILINSRGKCLEIHVDEFKSGKYTKKIRGYLK